MFKSLFTSNGVVDFAYNLAIMLAIIIISSFFLMFLWNRVLVQYVTICKPIRGLFDAFLLSLTISVIRGY
jgi:hypothetical protein